MNLLSNQPPKGTYDWLPEEFAVRKYIFDTWRRVCKQFGFEEYLTPGIESAEVYRAKSGEDIGGKELMVFTDKAGRELALRPEMTPSVTRMTTRFYEAAPKPIKLFSIANFFRNEKPQKGRNREFWQLNYDVFGEESIYADVEVLMVALEVMLSFNPPANSFVLKINHRKLIDYVLKLAEVDPEKITEVVRILDKFEKLSSEDFEKRLQELGVAEKGFEVIYKLMKSGSSEELLQNLPEIGESEAYKEVTTLLETLRGLGYGDYISFLPNVVRGFDYYDGMIFEAYDLNTENSRSLFGGR